jgi:thioester reductase-like protein
VNLLIKYKPSALQRVRNSFSGNERLYRLASSVSNVSKRHKIARVEIDAADKDEVMFELMKEEDVEMVEEVSCP